MRARFLAALLLCLGPILVTLAAGEEFWPFTYFPMYAAKSDRVMWAQVRGVNRETQAEETLVGEACFHPYGNTRFNYSLLNFEQNNSREKGNAILRKLAQRLPQNDCPSKGWSHLRGYIVWANPEDQAHWDFRRPSGERRVWEVPLE